ncbi:autotransporter outer membrane beta-barrel domain-containing protein [Helicobacter cappadocius]|uniref:Autotransporter outer membrane beta-barrel domain-containing protein n=1 Tax=Helicobacter cappadocius TaxID=3063998 RepID=A0AA90PKN5_9HELI|nr:MULTISPECIES: autotransporter outer membrane beta-barrel domain-containing protein [unclassified Helicobacter]MDO7253842.1 autotransporter outer membrane beta-barrel domain-containing protein [Helicobacter sp. faydin-H75]MDP2539731.1 autotransporter outer membrane beta-barrel domain-containing protein [Helicobacter sp. faydin-H76]
MNWGNEFPSSLTPENSSACITIGEDDSASPVYNKSDLGDSYFSSTYVEIYKNPKSQFTEFHNLGNFNFANGRNFTFDMPDVDYYLDGGLFNIQYGRIILNGRDFYSQGEFIVNHKLNLNFRDFINVSNTKISGVDGDVTINLTGKFSNDSKLNITGPSEYKTPPYITINGGDFYNGVDHSSSQEYFSGSIVLEHAVLTIKKNLISEGVDKDNRSNVILSNNSELRVSGDFINGAYSDVYINPSHNYRDRSKLSVYGNMINQGEIHLAAIMDDHGIYVGKNFISKEGSKLYFTGGYTYYGAIKATDVDIKGASVYFLKGETILDRPYDFLVATGIFSYDTSLLGVQDVISDDGSMNDFYEAVVGTGFDDHGARTLKVTYRYKTKKPKKEVNTSGNSNNNTTSTTITNNTDTTTTTNADTNTNIANTEPQKEVNISDNTSTTNASNTTSAGTIQPSKEEVSISSNNNTDTTTSDTDTTTNVATTEPQKEVNISDNSNNNTTSNTDNTTIAGNTTSTTITNNTDTIAKIPGIKDKYTSSEIAFIDAFSKENPIPGFDIKNLSMNQIRTISKNINDGLEYYSHSKDTALNGGFEAIKANVFSRMIGGGSSSATYHQARSDVLLYNPSNRYAINTKLAPPTDVVNIFKESTKSQKPNNLYVNVLGAFQTSSSGYGYGYGLSVGYDRNFEDKMFIGAYLAYIGGGQKLDMLSNQTQGFEIGVYGRFETSILETDLILNQGYAYNKNTKKITILDNIYSTSSGYGTQSFDVLLQSGPKFILGKNSIKPFVGVNLNFYTGANVTEDTEVFASSYDFKDSVYLSEVIGIEYKRAFKNGYFFLRPSYEANIYSNATETKVVFLNNTISIAPPAKEMFASVLLGGEMNINDSLLFNLNLSTKASNKKTFIATGLASLKYVF